MYCVVSHVGLPLLTPSIASVSPAALCPACGKHCSGVAHDKSPTWVASQCCACVPNGCLKHSRWFWNQCLPVHVCLHCVMRPQKSPGDGISGYTGRSPNWIPGVKRGAGPWAKELASFIRSRDFGCTYNGAARCVLRLLAAGNSGHCSSAQDARAPSCGFRCWLYCTFLKAYCWRQTVRRVTAILLLPSRNPWSSLSQPQIAAALRRSGTA